MARTKIIGYAFIVYPESMRNDTIEWLLTWFPCAISPLHNRDKFDDGTLKKPHYHVMITGSLSAQHKRWISDYTKNFFFEPIKDLYAYYHYLYHWDIKSNWYIEDKAQYWSADIRTGISFNRNVLRFNTDSNDLMRIVINSINQRVILEWSDFVDYILLLNDIDLQNFVIKNSNFIKNYIDSKRFKLNNSIKK